MAFENLFGKKKFKYKGPKTGKGWRTITPKDKIGHIYAGKGIATSKRIDHSNNSNKLVLNEMRFKHRCYTCNKWIGGKTQGEAYMNLMKHRRDAHGGEGAKAESIFGFGGFGGDSE